MYSIDKEMPNISNHCSIWIYPEDIDLWAKFNDEYLNRGHINSLLVDNFILSLFPTDRRFDKLYYTKETEEVQHSIKDVANGTLHEYTISFFIPGNSVELKTQLQKLEQQRFVVIFEDRNGTYNFYGDVENGVTFKFNHVNKKGERGYKIEISWQASHIAYSLDPDYVPGNTLLE